MDNYVRHFPHYFQRPLFGLHWLCAQASTLFIFFCIASWPFFPIIIQSRPWPIYSSIVFVTLLCLLAVILTCRSGNVESAFLVSGLTLLLTGLTAVQYTNSQTNIM